MFKVSSFILLLICLSFSNTFSQTSIPDSLRRIAIADVKKFKLDEEDLKKFKQGRSNSSSDLFKPSNLNTSNPSLLNDSAYVQTFRDAAYKKTKKANIAGHHKRIGVFGYLAAIAFVGLVFLGLNQI